MLLSEDWWKNDITNLQGQEFDFLILLAGHNQLIDKPIHAINNSIDLIFCTNQSVISNHRVYVSVFDKRHHNIIYDKINIRESLPPSNVRKV